MHLQFFWHWMPFSIAMSTSIPFPNPCLCVVHGCSHHQLPKRNVSSVNIFTSLSKFSTNSLMQMRITDDGPSADPEATSAYTVAHYELFPSRNTCYFWSLIKFRINMKNCSEMPLHSNIYKVDRRTTSCPKLWKD